MKLNLGGGGGVCIREEQEKKDYLNPWHGG